MVGAVRCAAVEVEVFLLKVPEKGTAAGSEKVVEGEETERV